ncbi:MAG: alpha/beta fold hydrolase, partial [Planctomycetota bacterium]
MMDGVDSKLKNLSIAALITFSSMSVLSGCAPESEHRAVSADNVAINYNVEGKGKPALVFVHGWCCDKSYWRHQVPHFSKRHKVVTIDLAGHGESGLGRKAWTIEAFGKDVAAVVKKLELDQVILIGHSMGGPVIIEAARQMPERVTGLVGVDTFLDLGKQYTQQQIDAFVAPFERDFAEATSKLVRGIF